MSRPDTPDMKNDDGSTTITVKRACNGCHRKIGDATHVEIDAAMYGQPLPDVRAECGCEPTAAATNQDPQQDRRHGMDVRVCASESRPAARADLTGSQTIRSQERTAVGQVAHAWTGGAPEPERPAVRDLSSDRLEEKVGEDECGHGSACCSCCYALVAAKDEARGLAHTLDMAMSELRDARAENERLRELRARSRTRRLASSTTPRSTTGQR